MTLTGRAFLLIGLTILGAFLGRFDHDAGGYVDRWLNTATYPKKGVHLIAGFAVTLALAHIVPAPWAVAGTIVAGGAYELGQGFFSWRDWAADAVGAVLAFALIVWLP